MNSAFKKSLATLTILGFSTPPVLADLRIKRRETRQGSAEGIESVVYLKGARQRTERTLVDTSKGRQQLVMIFIDQCDQKQFIHVDPMNKQYAVQVGWSHLSQLMAFGEMQVEMTPKQAAVVSRARSKSKGVVTQKTKVIDTGERREMFGFTARHLKTVTTWEANPKTCDVAERQEVDGWYVDLLYGIDCSPDLSGTIQQGHALPTGHCLRQYLKQDYWFEAKRIGSASPGYPLIEVTTFYDEKGRTWVMRNEVIEISNDDLSASLFEPPDGFERIEFKTKSPRRSLLGRVFSFL
jgi:hypothetical protein